MSSTMYEYKTRIGTETGELIGHFLQPDGTVLNKYEAKEFSTGKWVVMEEPLYRRSDGLLATSRLPFEQWYPPISQINRLSADKITEILEA